MQLALAAGTLARGKRWGRVVGEKKGTTFFNVLFPSREELEPRRCLIENKIDDEPSTFQAEVPAFS
jgi:hypothetical protein